MVRTKEGGSVPKFIIVGLVLVALLIGGGFWLRHQAKQPEVTQPPAPEQPAEPPVGPTRPVTPEQSQDPKQVESQSNPVLQPPQGASLPQTGPSENVLLASLMLGILAAVATGYVRSRREIATF